jgi:hypothetical protein
MFLGLPDPDPLVRGMDLDPGSGSFYQQAKIVRKTLILNCFVTSFGLYL